MWFLAMTLALWALPQSGAQVDLQSGLQLYLTFDEGAGDRAGDLSGNFRTARVHEAAQFAGKEILWSEGRFGGAVDFDGTYFLTSPEYFGIGGRGARTISMWVNAIIPPSGSTVLVAWGPNQTQQRWHFKFESTTSGVRTENQGGSNFGGIPVVDGAWHHVVSVFPEDGATIGAVDHYIDGVLDPRKSGTLTTPVNTVADPLIGPPVTVGGAPFNTIFRFATALIDDVRIYNRALNAEEIAALAAGQGVVSGAPPIITPPAAVEGNAFVNAAGGLTFTISPVPASSTIANITLLLNGTSVTPQTQTDPNGNVVTATYNGLAANTAYTLELQATDSAGLRSSRRFSFATYSETNFIIEAEDYNFEGGQFYNNPVPCNVLGGQDNCYFDKISAPGVDSFDSRGFTDDTTSFDAVYRFSRGTPQREEEFDTLRSTDAPRQRHIDSGVSDYDVNLLNTGDWANYTRDFPEADAFRILLRSRATAAQVVRLDRVTTDPTLPNQVVTLLGTFLVPASASYTLTPLTDLSGQNELTVVLRGRQTLRLTAEGANNNLNLNYMMFIPAANTAILPTAALVAPANNSIHAGGSTINLLASADDDDGFVARVNFSAVVNGVETALGSDSQEPYEFAWANVSEGVHTLTAKAIDDDGLEGVSQPVRIIVDSTAPLVNSVRESPALDAIELIFSEELDETSAELIGNYQISPALTISSAIYSGRRVTLATDPQTRGVEYTVRVQGVIDAHGVTQPGTSATFTAGESSLSFGLELYLPFDETSGGAAADLSGFGRSAGMYNAPAFAGLPIVWTEGRFAGAVDFNGTYFLGVPGYYGIGGNAPRTISMWIKTSWVVGGGNALMAWGRNVTGQRWHFKLDNTANGALRTENQGGNNYGSVLVNDGQWHHIVVVMPDGGTVIGDVNHYVDGIFDSVKNGSLATAVNTSVDPLLASIVTVGGGPLNAELRRVTALLDDVRLYNRALSDTEILALSQGQGVIGGEPPDPPALLIQRLPNGNIELSWERGLLQSTPALGQSWSNVADARSPYAITPTGTAFYRLMIPAP